MRRQGAARPRGGPPRRGRGTPLSAHPATREERVESLRRFLRTIQKPDRPLERLGEEESLVESGLIDSLAVLQIVTHLEETYGIDFAGTGIDPSDLRSIASILDLVERQTA